MAINDKRSRIAPMVAALVLAAALLFVPSTVHAAPPVDPATLGQGALSDPATALGTGWMNSSDTLVTGAGDSDGYHIYEATESNGFAWRTVATLTSSALDLGPWTGQVCVTGSGKYAVAVFAPAVATNKPALMEAGGLAAVVDLATGQAHEVADGVQLAYFNPACGPGDRALLTRAIGDDEQRTDLLTVDAATSTVTSTRRIDAQFTTPAPAPDGDYGIVGGTLVRVDSKGKLSTIAHPAGRVVNIQATAHNGIDLVSVQDKKAVAQRFWKATLTTLGSGVWDRLQLFGQIGGSDVLVGDTADIKNAVPELSTVPNDKRVDAVSAQGHLLAEQVVSAQTAHTVSSPLSRTDSGLAGTTHVEVRATHSGQRMTATIRTMQVSTLNVTLGTSSGAQPTTNNGTAQPNVSVAAPACAIPRLDPTVQALQSSPNQVEWAVDQAVHNNLNILRPTNYLQTGQPSYRPQVMFGITEFTIPAQIELGILAQESNLSEASWHAVPGDVGDPLVADYYGNGNGSNDVIDYSKSDCGYGIGQVTDGMQATATSFSHAQQVAIATDYAANIAESLQILAQKWQQVDHDPAGGSFVNNNDPSYIENWFLAVWAYNSGYHAYADRNNSGNGGHWGVGWLNNPANPVYPADRDPFLRGGYSDAAVPSHWSYEEKVMGWAETPQLKGSGNAYAQPNFGPSAAALTLPSIWTFCAAGNSCTPNTTNPCPAVSSACWWNGFASFANCPNECATEHLTYAVGSSEPPIQRIYPLDCENFTGSNDPDHYQFAQTHVVYDLNDTSQYAQGCAVNSQDGKFTLRLTADSLPADNAYYAKVDLHQGVGYNGHTWFTHMIPSSTRHKVTATWSPQLSATGWYDIVVHIPSHGGETTHANFVVLPTVQDTPTATCVINQNDNDSSGTGHDEWKYIGSYNLNPGARVQLNNIGNSSDNGTIDVAYDAMAFVPINGNPGTNKCNSVY
jgi:hypothetical protein